MGFGHVGFGFRGLGGHRVWASVIVGIQGLGRHITKRGLALMVKKKNGRGLWDITCLALGFP